MRALLALAWVEVRTHRMALGLYPLLLAGITAILAFQASERAATVVVPILLYSSLAYGLIAIAAEAMPREGRTLLFFDRGPHGLSLAFVAKLGFAWLALAGIVGMAWGAIALVRAANPPQATWSAISLRYDAVPPHVYWGAFAAVPWLVASTAWSHRGALAALIAGCALAPHALWALADPRHLPVFPVLTHVPWLLPAGAGVAWTSFVLGRGRGGSCLRAVGLGSAAAACLLAPLWGQLGWWAYRFAVPAPGDSLILDAVLAPESGFAYVTLQSPLGGGPRSPTFAVRADLARGTSEGIGGKDSHVAVPVWTGRRNAGASATVVVGGRSGERLLDSATRAELGLRTDVAGAREAWSWAADPGLRARIDVDLRAVTLRALPGGGAAWLALAAATREAERRLGLAVHLCRADGRESVLPLPANAIVGDEAGAGWIVLRPGVGAPWQRAILDLHRGRLVEVAGVEARRDHVVVLGREWLVRADATAAGSDAPWVLLDPDTGTRRPTKLLAAHDRPLTLGTDGSVLVAERADRGLRGLARVDFATGVRAPIALPQGLPAAEVLHVSELPVPAQESARRCVLAFSTARDGTWVASLRTGQDRCTPALRAHELLGFDRDGGALLIDHNRTHILRADLDRGTWQLAWPRE
ncbi:MAG: hypothetical protein IT458_02280 [Planctomycetes bacterium]|nr:hypothetical protein [Planctomycetota bacterium]